MLRNLGRHFRLVLVDNWEGDAATFPPGSFGVADMAVVVPGDRHDVVMAACLAELSGTRLAALLLSAGTEPDPRVWDLTRATRATGLPILVVDDSSYETATRMRDLGPGLPIDDLERIEAVTDTIADALGAPWLESLPSSAQPRRPPDQVTELARILGLHLPDGVTVVDPQAVAERYVAPLATLRKHRGWTEEISLVGVLHVPARRGGRLRRLRYQPQPGAEDPADIAIQSAASARAFGVEPRVAMISYSTGTSGSGVDVDKVAEATRVVRELEPGLAVDGPLQYNAAAIVSVGQTKRPGSAVAGRANVFIFPDLNTGNTTYKAVQRSAQVVSVGPMLQGLAKPVNDLSRGALVEDIVYTVALTAIQSRA